jgi:translocation and assembly module TamA
MVQVAGWRPRFAVALAVAAFIAGQAAAQQPGDGLDELNAPLDPSVPLKPLPEIGAPEQQQAPISPTPDTSVAATATEHEYDVQLDGLGDAGTPELISQFRQLSSLEEGRKSVANAAQIDRRAREDANLLAELLRAHGYYDASVDPEITPAEPKQRVRVTLHAAPGEVYRFADIRLPGLDAAGPDTTALRDAFGVKPHDPVTAEEVIKGEGALTVELGKRGYAFADVGEPDITVDHETRTATLVLPVEPNGVREFGQVVVEGEPLFSARHIQRIARFRPGGRFETPLLDDLRRALIATALVGSAEVRPVARPNSKVVDVAVKLTRAPVHTVAGELGYGTGEGAKILASWQHRNLIKPEGAVTIQGVLGTQEQSLGITLRQNNFHRRDQVLNAQIAASHLHQNAFDARTFRIGANRERQTNIIWQKKWTWSLGTELIASDEKAVDADTATIRRRTYLIAALPATLSYDGSDDLLDPTRGFRLSARLSPELSLQNGAFGYGRLQLDGSAYHPVSGRVVIAGRIRLGTIIGASRDRIAPSRRFYAGGGGSVRGFGYQDLGPRDPIFNDPLGGRSLAEFALEARIRVGNFGIVPFIDAGNIYTSPLPHIDELRFGTGIGLRYYSSFGPIRVDVGTPIGRRPGEPRIAVYVSLGQAF